MAVREIKTLEVDRWSKPDENGYVKHLGMISAYDAFKALNDHLRSVGLVPDEYFMESLDVKKDGVELPDFYTATCNVEWGTNEGLILSINMMYNKSESGYDFEPGVFNFASGKTLRTDGDAFLEMSRIAAECSMFLNGRGRVMEVTEPDITPEKENKIEVDLDFAKLLVEKNENKDYREVFVGLQNQQGDYQDLAVIGQEYDYDEDLNVVFKPSVSVKVYGDKEIEDFTDDFSVGLSESFERVWFPNIDPTTTTIQDLVENDKISLIDIAVFIEDKYADLFDFEIIWRDAVEYGLDVDLPNDPEAVYRQVLLNETAANLFHFNDQIEPIESKEQFIDLVFGKDSPKRYQTVHEIENRIEVGIEAMASDSHTALAGAYSSETIEKTDLER